MNSKSKALAGVSGLSVIIFIIHLVHAVHTLATIERNNNGSKTGPVYMIYKDFSGKSDTILMEQYLKQRNKE